MFLQLICCAGFAQTNTDPCGGGKQDPPSETPPLPDQDPSVEANIPSEAPIDPNEIIGLDGYDAVGIADTFRWVSATQTLAYTVYFENDAELAMAAASKVTINVPLHPKLNYATLGIGSFGFGNHIFAVEGSPSSYQTRIDLRDSLGIFVDVVAGLDIVHNEAFWIFQSIDPATGLPPIDINSGFLPINDSLHSGEGFVSFTIKPKADQCVTGDTVSAMASIVFDVNEAIPTNTWVNTIDAFPPTSTLNMVPNGADQLVATFSGEDDEDGCGVKQFKLYYSVNNNAYQLYHVYPAGDTAEIPLESGSEYQFFVLAEDNVGNCEPMKTQSEYNIGTSYVTLAVNAFPQEAGTVTGGGGYAVNDTAVLTATAAEGYHFVNWMLQGAPVSTQNPYSVVVTQNQTYTAYFERNAYTLQTLAADGSTITVTDLNGNEIPSGSTVLHADKLIVQTAHEQCYDLIGGLVNHIAFTSGDTLTVTRNTVISTQTLSLLNTSEFEVVACNHFDWNGSTYTQSGNYTQTLVNATGCDSVVTLHLTIASLSHSPDTVILAGTSASLWASGMDTLVWSDVNGDILEIGPSLTVAPTCSTTYYITGLNQRDSIGDNLVVNGDFEQGNVGFNSGYVYNEIVFEGAYYVGYNGRSHYGSFDTWYDHTTGSGLYMIVNGAETLNSNVWTQTVAVEANTDYALSAWVCNLSSRPFAHGDTDDVAQLQVSINDAQLGEIFYVPEISGWVRVYKVWNSGNDTTATITINNQNPSWGGNDFGLDDIVFLPLTDCSVTDSVSVFVDYSATDERSICSSELPYTWDGVTFTEFGSQTVTLVNAAGCDSVVTMNLIPLLESYYDTVVIACSSFDWYEHSHITESGNYTHVFEGENIQGCDSIATLHLTVNQPTQYINIVNACDAFTWIDGVTYTESTATPTVTLTNAAGCDSVVTLNLTIRHSTDTVLSVTIVENDLPFVCGYDTLDETGSYTVVIPNTAGCDSTIYLHLTVNLNVIEYIDSIVCETALPVTWNDSVFTTADTKTTTILSSTGADSIVVMTLYVVPTTYDVLDTTIVENSLPLALNGNEYMQPGTYTQVLTSWSGCDSILTVNLTVHHNVRTSFDTTVCDSFDWNGITYTQSGDYTQQFSSIYGSDSIVTTHLTVHNPDYTEFYISACDSYDWNGETYTESGIYVTTLSNVGGCDSVVTLHLTINLSDTIEFHATACDSYNWNGTTYTESGDYVTYMTNASGCDLAVILHLAIGHSDTTDLYITACDSYTWNDSFYFESGDYVQHFHTAQGCDSIVTLHLTVNQPTQNTVVVNACDTFTWIDGATYTESTYTPTVTFTNEAGCDSVVTLNLSIRHSTDTVLTATVVENALPYVCGFDTFDETGSYTVVIPNTAGCDSTIYLHLSVNLNVIEYIDSIVCETALPVTWNDSVFTTADTKTTTILSSTGADSIVVMALYVVPTTYGVLDTTIVENNLPLALNGNEYMQPGTYTQTLTSWSGCDSILTVNLTVHHNVWTSFDTTVCDSFDWNGITYTQSGDYTQQFSTIYGSDSIVTTHLTVHNPDYTEFYISACDSYDWNGETYTESGIYVTTLSNVGGCDSVVTLHLTINLSDTIEFHATACDSYNWNGVTYTESGDYVTYMTNTSGCDLAVILHLAIDHSDTTDLYVIACDSYNWNGATYTGSGTYSINMTNAAGCDSLIFLHLTINHSASSNEYITICRDELPYTYGDTVFGTSTPALSIIHYPLSTINGCDSVVTLYLTVYDDVTSEFFIVTSDSCYTWNSQSYCTSGDYTQTLQTVHGCDSLVTLHLTITVGVDDYDGFDFKVYPNPTSNVVQCTMNNVQAETFEIRLYDAYGRLLDVVEANNYSRLQTAQIDLSRYANGVYFLKAVADEKVIAVRKVVKQ